MKPLTFELKPLTWLAAKRLYDKLIVINVCCLKLVV